MSNVVSILDAYRLRDGRRIGDLGYYEMEDLLVAAEREALIIEGIRNSFVCVPDETMTVRELLTPDELEEIVWRATEAASGEKG